MPYRHVVRWVSEAPWALVPSTLAAIVDTLAIRAAGETLSPDEISARIGTPREPGKPESAGGVALIPLHGVIMPRASLFADVSGGMSVETFRGHLAAALADDDIDHIVIDIDSPGGRVEMVHELAAELRAARADKRITAQVNTLAGSAAYWLAAQADEIVATPSGSVGSIGVFAAHEDLSAAREEAGVKTTLISQGRFKTEANPFEPLSEDARAHIQELVDETYDRFVTDVAAGRGVPVDVVKSGYGEGRLVTASMGRALGMVDDIATLETTLGRALAPDRPAARVATVHVHDLNANTGAYSGTTTNPPGDLEVEAGPIGSHSTPTTDAGWDGPANKARLRNDGDAAYYRSAFAWVDSSADANVKASYKFIHHMVGTDGRVGAANTTACSTGIGVLNGGRGGTTIPDGDRRGVYAHLARHIRDSGADPPPLQGRTFVEEVNDALAAVAAVLDRTDSLAEYRDGDRLTAVKRHAMTELRDRLGDVLARTEPQPRVVPLDELDEHDFTRF